MSDGELLGTGDQPGKRVGGATGKGWTPGRSGNPRGRPRAPFDIAAMCREHAPEAVATLVAALKDPRHKVAAASELLNRGFGRPRQVIESSDGASPSALHLLAAQLVSAEVLAAFERRNTIEGRAEAKAFDFLTAPIPTE